MPTSARLRIGSPKVRASSLDMLGGSAHWAGVVMQVLEAAILQFRRDESSSSRMSCKGDLIFMHALEKLGDRGNLDFIHITTDGRTGPEPAIKFGPLCKRQLSSPTFGLIFGGFASCAAEKGPR